MLTDTEIAHFIQDGYTVARGAVAPPVVAACQDVLWSELAGRGVLRQDASTWTQPVVRVGCPEGGPFVAAGTAPPLWEAYDQLLGEGTWWKREGVGGSIPVRFPSEADPGDAGWHIDSSFVGPDGQWSWVNVNSRMRGLLAVFLLTDVDERSAPTRILKGSHLDVPRVLAPAGETGLRGEEVIPLLPARAFQHEVVLATGQSGDVFLCHPFLVHAASWPHRGAHARMIAQPGVAIFRQFELRPDRSASDVCPAEAAILHGLREYVAS